MQPLTRIGFLFLVVCSATSWAQDGFDFGNDEDDRVRRIVEERKRREQETVRQPTSLDGGATVNPVVLDTILDDTHGLRYEERDAYFRILELAWQTPLSEQQQFARDFREARWLAESQSTNRAAGPFPVLADMINHPDDYRGRPVTVRGVLRKLTKFDPGQNVRQIGDVYEAWIYTDDSRARTPDHSQIVIPTVVVFQGKPDGLEVGGDLSEEVRITGYFFKLYRYDAQDRGWKAPLLLAGAIEWKRHEPTQSRAYGPEVYLLVGTFVLMFGFVWWQGERREMSSGLRSVEADFASFTPIESLAEPHDS